MITLRKSNDRGRFDHGWLDTRHTFSFGAYHDPAHMSFGPLRVMNEDFVKPGKGFGMHGHQDMEIVTYILDGALQHKDSMGNGSVLRAGDLQRITAGTGMLHSEFNPSDSEPVQLYQIWILPERPGLEPGYEELHLGTNGHAEGFRLVASRNGRDGSLTIHQEAAVYLGAIRQGETKHHTTDDARKVWVQALRGSVEVNGQRLDAGDGAAIEQEKEVTITGRNDAEVLLFDLA